MKKLITIIAFLFISAFVNAQVYHEHVRWIKKTTAEKLAIDISDTTVVYEVYDTDLQRKEISNDGLTWVAASTGGSTLEIASVAEINAGVNNLKAITPLGLAGSQLALEANTAYGWGNHAILGYALTSNPLSQFAATTSAQLSGIISNETGAGQLVFGLNPTFSNNITVEGNVVVDTGGAVLTDGMIELTPNNGVDIESVSLKDGNVDGRDVSADGIRLDGMEDNSTADQTASEVPIVDAGGLITATEVEGALQENRTAIDLNTARDSKLQISSTINTSRTALFTDLGGMNIVSSPTNINITIPLESSVPFEIGHILQYKREGAGDVIINYEAGVSGTVGQTYNKDEAIAVWKTGTDTWELINPPRPDYVVSARTGSVIDMSVLTQYNFGAATAAISFAIQNIAIGAYAEVLINTPTEPVVTGATKLPNTASWIASTDIVLCIKDFNGTRKFWFVIF